MKVELIWDDDCPNVEETRANLRRACSSAGVEEGWTEWRRDDPAAPDYVRQYGSPTILVEGEDVADVEADADGNCCRIYTETDGKLSGVPSVSMIEQRLDAARSSVG